MVGDVHNLRSADSQKNTQRSNEIAAQLSNAATDITNSLDSLITDANAKVDDLNDAFFGGENVDQTQLVKNLGFSSFKCGDNTYSKSDSAVEGKIFQVFDLEHHCVSLEAEDGNLLFKKK